MLIFQYKIPVSHLSFRELFISTYLHICLLLVCVISPPPLLSFSESKSLNETLPKQISHNDDELRLRYNLQLTNSEY